MQMLRGLFGDGSLNDLLFPTEGVEKLKNQINAIKKNTYGSEDDEDSDASENEFEGALIVKMLGTMLAKKKSTAECLAINRDISLDKLRKELRAYQLQDMKDNVLRRGNSEKRIAIASNIAVQVEEKPLLDHPVKMEKDRREAKAFAERDANLNPFFKALKTQKQERDEQMRLEVIEKRLERGLLPMPPQEGADFTSEQVLTSELQGQTTFMTHVEITDRPQVNVNLDTQQTDEVNQVKTSINEQLFSPVDGQARSIAFNQSELNYNLPTSNREQNFSGIDSNEQNVHESHPLPLKEQQPFCFYELKVDLPATMIKQLGDFQIATQSQIEGLQKFILQRWPIFQRKRISFKVAVQEGGDVFNVVLINNSRKSLCQIPLSNCCKMGVNFSFSRAIGGRIICMEALCSRNPCHNFFFDHGLYMTLFPHQIEPISAMQSQMFSSQAPPQTAPGRSTNETNQPMQLKQVNTRFDRAVSHEISRRVSKGNIRQTALSSVITDNKFQQETLNQIIPVSQLMTLIMGNGHRRSKKNSKKLNQKKNHEMKEALDEISRVIGIDPNQQMVTHEQQYATLIDDSHISEMLPEQLLATGI